MSCLSLLVQVSKLCVWWGRHLSFFLGLVFQERTKNAQFIIISLRNNMFELADRLIGIYKTHNCTKSVTIDPHKIGQAVMAAAGPSTSLYSPSQPPPTAVLATEAWKRQPFLLGFSLSLSCSHLVFWQSFRFFMLRIATILAHFDHLVPSCVCVHLFDFFFQICDKHNV